MYESAHVAITFQLLEIEFFHNTRPNNLEYSHKVNFKEFFYRKNIGDCTHLRNEKNLEVV